MRLILLSLLIMFWCNLSFAQKSLDNKFAKEGTFELISNNPKFHEVITTDVLGFIEENRHDSKLVVVKVGKYTYARILPKSTINSSSFKPVSSQIMYVEEEIQEVKF